jgi:hypothetical protein
MASDKWTVRDAAHRKLKDMGQAVVPLLARYVNHKDPEVASRVKAIIADYQWMTRGVIVLTIKPGSHAEKLGLHAGDVIVKIDDTPTVDRETAAQTGSVFELGELAVIMPLRTGRLWQTLPAVANMWKPSEAYEKGNFRVRTYCKFCKYGKN